MSEEYDNTPSRSASLFTSGFPMPGERVTVTRRSGKKLIARLAVKPDSVFRLQENMHWLTDQDKFADVDIDPIVAWNR